ncbi:hypothetical protein ACFX2H_015268 [Malus domestica]
MVVWNGEDEAQNEYALRSRPLPLGLLCHPSSAMSSFATSRAASSLQRLTRAPPASRASITNQVTLLKSSVESFMLDFTFIGSISSTWTCPNPLPANSHLAHDPAFCDLRVGQPLCQDRRHRHHKMLTGRQHIRIAIWVGSILLDFIWVGFSLAEFPKPPSRFDAGLQAVAAGVQGALPQLQHPQGRHSATPSFPPSATTTILLHLYCDSQPLSASASRWVFSNKPQKP